MEFLSYRENEKIGTVTIQNDKQRNALSSPLIKEFNELLQEISLDKKVNVLIIEAEGKIFSSGHNLREVAHQPQESILHLFQECGEFMKKLRNIPQVTIAKVHGIATAAGCQLVAACDLAVASENAQFSTPGANIGFFCSTPAVFISRNVGRKKAAEMLFTADYISAEDALLHGLVNKVVPLEQLDEATTILAQSVARHSSAVLDRGKKEFYQQIQMEDFQALNYAIEVATINSVHPDAIEGIGAFIEKRKPQWSDRLK